MAMAMLTGTASAAKKDLQVHLQARKLHGHSVVDCSGGVDRWTKAQIADEPPQTAHRQS